MAQQRRHCSWYTSYTNFIADAHKVGTAALNLPTGDCIPLWTPPLLRAHQRWTRQGQAPTMPSHRAGTPWLGIYPSARLRTDHPPSSLPPQTAEHTSRPGCCGVRSDRRCVLSTRFLGDSSSPPKLGARPQTPIGVARYTSLHSSQTSTISLRNL